MKNIVISEIAKEYSRRTGIRRITRCPEDPNLTLIIFNNGIKGYRHIHELGFSSWEDMLMKLFPDSVEIK